MTNTITAIQLEGMNEYFIGKLEDKVISDFFMINPDQELELVQALHFEMYEPIKETYNRYRERGSLTKGPFEIKREIVNRYDF